MQNWFQIFEQLGASGFVASSTVSLSDDSSLSSEEASDSSELKMLHYDKSQEKLHRSKSQSSLALNGTYVYANCQNRATNKKALSLVLMGPQCWPLAGAQMHLRDYRSNRLNF